VEQLAPVAAALDERDREVIQLCRSPKFSIEALRALVRSFQ